MYFIVIYVNDIIFFFIVVCPNAIKTFIFYISRCFQNFKTVLELSQF